MGGAPTIWVNGDMSEQISDYNGQYILVLMNSMQKILLGNSLEAAREKLVEIGREDIAKQIK